MAKGLSLFETLMICLNFKVLFIKSLGNCKEVKGDDEGRVWNSFQSRKQANECKPGGQVSHQLYLPAADFG